ncbi:YdcF family protein [Actinomarinicola tropica]|uniref:YdcF family protein n=1 Tax=Actinomarinicola tropica TaxID=2789776 RepID=UPI00189B6825|nr:YdcF family protein [Actinomarinicola tropica]
MRRTLRWGRRLTILAVGLLALGLVYVAVTFVHVWSTARSDQAGPADAIVVLGAAQYDGEPSPVLRARLDHAAELYDAGHAPLVVVTGGKQEGDRVTQAAAGFTYLRRQGIPEDAILLEVDGTSTYSELAATARILEDRGLSRVLMVSDGYHSARLLAIADEVGLDGAVSPTDTGYGTGALLRETAALSVGRIVGFRRLDALG